MADLLTTVTAPAYAYLFLLALLAADAFVPIVPTQAVMITAGALTVYGQLSLPVTIGVGTLGVLAGDVSCYLLGRVRPRRGGVGYQPRHAHRGRAARLANRLRRPGPLALLLCRFLPGGRMTACFYAGRLRYPYRRFLAYEGLAALGWASYGGLVGHLGGSALAGSGWRLALIAAVAAGAFGMAGWGLTLVGSRRSNPAATPDPDSPPADPVPSVDHEVDGADTPLPVPPTL
ncbi:DedA family protein [Plantactinospora siamensis]|uniref:DedA family protein n=1 Tax=Plantactinospora siamensis TaxID=555372 RepID=A0ABV6NWT7_9ACTN